MRIGYACVNTTFRESASRTFRVASYSEDRARETTASNLAALDRILAWNVENGISYFRLSSGTVPLASHPVMAFDWRSAFAAELAALGAFARDHGMRLTMHPGQYTLLNSPREDVVKNSIDELVYHADLLDLMGMDGTHKIQLHVGGVYGDKGAATRRFIDVYGTLPEVVRRRLVIEHEERHYCLADLMPIHEETGVPIVFDVFHHRLYSMGESVVEALARVAPVWEGHGPMMVDYSTQDPSKRWGAHTESIDLDDFAALVPDLTRHNADVMLEIKDKEQSALRANALLVQ